ncbi:hypothetical protein GUJ93_ZPchr0006g45649 [Zizania palustris]|uniref:UBA domain-containing protein n=1 Tax=Zizania palustris TaxID=103762 RepID=A0A8J5SN19_ZIZPA|nr:hypothetical protein GUJ93_ZPchr0006g45649 [Zizania palustris]
MRPPETTATAWRRLMSPADRRRRRRRGRSSPPRASPTSCHLRRLRVPPRLPAASARLLGFPPPPRAMDWMSSADRRSRMYAEAGDMGAARAVFDGMPRRDAVTWNAAFIMEGQVKEFVKSYNTLHEMGFTSSNVPELLAIHDNDPDKVIPLLIG